MVDERITTATATETMAVLPQERKVSWGAIIAGLFVTITAMLMLNLLGTAIGLTVGASTQSENQPTAQSYFTAGGIWAGLSALIALFLGGYVAARMAGVPTSSDGAWQGVIHWATVVIVALGLLSYGLQTAVGLTLQAAGMGMSAAAADRSGMVAGAIEAQADKVAGDLNIRNLSAENRRQLAASLGRGDFDAAAGLLADNSNGALTRERAKARIDEMMVAFRAQASEVGRRVVEYGAPASWTALFVLGLGLLSSLAGGAMGVPNAFNRLRERHVTRTDTTPTVGRPVGA